jgi:hypothetical protein
MRYVFTKESGAIANLEFLGRSFQDHELEGLLTVEVYLRDGSVRTVTNQEEAMSLLKELRKP